MYNVIFVTAKDKKEARAIAQVLLEARLIACANIVPGIESMFWWEGKIERSPEVLLVMKTRAENFERIRALVKEKHSYETPEIIAVPVEKGDEDYLRWLTWSVER